jgi:hypothetical protein
MVVETSISSQTRLGIYRFMQVQGFLAKLQSSCQNLEQICLAINKNAPKIEGFCESMILSEVCPWLDCIVYHKIRVLNNPMHSNCCINPIRSLASCLISKRIDLRNWGHEDKRMNGSLVPGIYVTSTVTSGHHDKS